MCPLQIINDIEYLSLTLHGVNGTFIHHPSNGKNYSNGHKSEKSQPNQKKKKVHPSYIFLHLSANLWLKIQSTNGQKSSLNFFDTSTIGTQWPTKQSNTDMVKNPK